MYNMHLDNIKQDNMDYYKHIDYIIELSRINDFKNYSFEYLYTKYYKFTIFNKYMRKDK